MIRNKIKEELNSLLPAYINGTLNPVQQKIVEQWLARSEQGQKTADNLRALQTAVRSQALRTPPPAVLSKIKAEIHSPQTAPQWLSKHPSRSLPAQKPALGLPILVLVVMTLFLGVLIMWQTLPPGIVLQWSVEGRTPETFRVYRAEVAPGQTEFNGRFELLEELPATEPDRSYTFIDFRLLPGQNYVYRVEGLNAAGQPAASQTITGQAVDALPGQLAILLVLVFAVYCFWQMLRLYRPLVVTPI